MCPDRFSIVGWMLRNSMADAERATPGKGCELISAFSAVGDMGLLVGLVIGLVLAYFIHDVIDLILRSRLYRQWKEARNVD
jgi:hypothetical protein